MKRRTANGPNGTRFETRAEWRLNQDAAWDIMSLPNLPYFPLP